MINAKVLPAWEWLRSFPGRCPGIMINIIDSSVRINPLFPAKRFKEKNYINCYYPYTEILDSITEFKKVGQTSLTHPAGKGSSFGFGRTTGVCCGVPFTEKQNKFQENLNMKFFQKQQCSICGSQSVQIFIDLYKL
jgi:hypothetical protein